MDNADCAVDGMESLLQDASIKTYHDESKTIQTLSSDFASLQNFPYTEQILRNSVKLCKKKELK